MIPYGDYDSLTVAAYRTAPRRRRLELDVVRGLAIVLMLLDHVAYLVGLEEVRLTVGRLAMPLFFVLAGGLFTRLSRRHAYAAGLGLVLPLLAPWAGSPNVLVVFAVGCVLLSVAGPWVPLLVVVPLALMANRWGIGDASYDPAALIALMGLGRLISFRWALSLGRYLPDWLAVLGRRPLWWYVGNVLLIQGVVLWVSRG